ncbi:MAG TPA: type II toxin-antitoxin system Phd/YefM family antitoxin [Tepidiformaceae bacterium]|nr:type II toxin-antitoxin system Phd/YefM family antitoxin [Tepidiformaceae bacterium]HMO96654.1 type II toxin-antitoxin system Phd/YefM family antitoxin [Tepidiformaceae bacterium]
MKTVPVTRARQDLYRLIDEVAASSEPVQISGPRSDAVLVSASDWEAIQETLYLLSVPGLREDLKEGMAAPLEESFDEPEW